MNIFAGLFGQIGERVRVLMLGTARHALVNATGLTANNKAVPAFLNCREIYVDVAGTVKYDYVDDEGETRTEVQYLPLGPWPHRNVCAIYGTIDGSTACTGKVYDDNGNLVVGMKVRR